MDNDDEPPEYEVEYKKVMIDEDENKEKERRLTYTNNTFYLWKAIKRRVFGGIH